MTSQLQNAFHAEPVFPPIPDIIRAPVLVPVRRIVIPAPALKALPWPPRDRR